MHRTRPGLARHPDASDRSSDRSGATDECRRRVRGKAWIHYPKTFGEDSYVRYSPVNILRGTIDVELRTAAAVQGRQSKRWARRRASPAAILKQPPFVWVLDTRQGPKAMW
jgi:hypothetical protein